MAGGIFLDPVAVSGTGAALHTSAQKIDGAGRKARSALRNQGCLPPGWSGKANGMISRTSKTGYTADLLSTTGLELKHRASLAAKSQAAGSLGRGSALPSKGLSPLMKAATDRKFDPWRQQRPSSIKNPGRNFRAIDAVIAPPKVKPKSPNKCEGSHGGKKGAKIYAKDGGFSDYERDLIRGSGPETKHDRKTTYGPQAYINYEGKYGCTVMVGDVKTAAALRAHAEATAESVIRVDSKGMKGKVQAGGKVQVSVPVTAEVGAIKITLAPAGAAGLQGGGDITAGQQDNGKYKFGGKISAVLGLGGEIAASIEIDPSKLKGKPEPKPRVIKLITGPDGKLRAVLG